MDNYGLLKDRSAIHFVITSGSDTTKQYLTDNPYVTMQDLEALVANSGPSVRASIARLEQHDNPAFKSLLEELTRDRDKMVRDFAICNPLSDFALFRETVLSGKVSVRNAKLYMCSAHSTRNLEVFKYLWRNYTYSANALLVALETALNKQGVIDGGILDFVHYSILVAPNKVREEYAGSFAVSVPDVLDKLKDDTYKPVVTALTLNKMLLPSTQRYLLNKYRSSSIWVNIAYWTEDSQVLNQIYVGTRSSGVRDAVRKNPAFILQ